MAQFARPNPKAVGAVSEMMLMAALTKRGYTVLVPFGDNARYDFVFEREGRFHRVQCKTGLVRDDGALVFPVCSSAAHRNGPFRTYAGEIDYFGVYSPALDRCFLIPFDDLKHCKRRAVLRLEPSKNGQLKGTRTAAEYAL